MTVFLSGLGLGFSLIVAIGAQNAFVLRQGLRNEHIFWVCLLCALSDAILMILGVLFFDKIRSILPWVETVLRIAGTIYLLWYALNRFRAAFSETAFLQSSGGETAPLLATLTSSVMLTWLNPHVYIDTVILVGSVASGFGVARWYFASGAISASFLFFFALGYGAKGLSGVLGRPTMWRMMDGAIGVLLLVIAYQLLEPLLI